MACDLQNRRFFSSLFILALPSCPLPLLCHPCLPSLPFVFVDAAAARVYVRVLHLPSSSLLLVFLSAGSCASRFFPRIRLHPSPSFSSSSSSSAVRTCTCPFFCRISARFFGPRTLGAPWIRSRKAEAMATVAATAGGGGERLLGPFLRSPPFPRRSRPTPARKGNAAELRRAQSHG